MNWREQNFLERCWSTGSGRSRRLIFLLTGAWACAVLFGLGWLLRWSNTPDPAGAVPAHWPAASAIRLDAERPTLVVFAHPRCPCTRATLGELALLMARSGEGCRAYVIFVQPEGMASEWVTSDLWQTAVRIAGVAVRADPSGREAARFQSETSGQTALYDPEGHLLFQGGITGSRGHAGENRGRSTLADLLEHRGAAGGATPVFGCALVANRSRPGSSTVERCSP
jgi:hypothetical protein